MNQGKIHFLLVAQTRRDCLFVFFEKNDVYGHDAFNFKNELCFDRNLISF